MADLLNDALKLISNDPLQRDLFWDNQDGDLVKPRENHTHVPQ